MNWRKTLSYLVLIVGWFLIGYFVRGLNFLPIVPLDQELALIKQAGEAVSAQNYNEMPPTRQMTYGAIRGLLSTIDDKYAEFWDPQAAARFDLRRLARLPGQVCRLPRTRGKWHLGRPRSVAQGQRNGLAALRGPGA